jgi:hypothetical protein
MPGYVAHPAARKVETQMPNPGPRSAVGEENKRMDGWMDGLAAPCGVFGKDEDTRCGLRARLPF